MRNNLCILAGLAALLLGCVPEKFVPAPPLPEAPPLMSTENHGISKGIIPPMTKQVKVAFLVPLSGESAKIGNAMLDAGTMALYDYYLALPSDQIRSQVILVPKDSGATPIDAGRAAQLAIDEGASFVIGPLFSQSVSMVEPVAAPRHIGVLTFSNTKSVANNHTFIFGFLPEQQIARVAEYAYLRGYQRVALLAPNDAYGTKMQETLTEIYTQKGGSVAPVELYAPSPSNIDAAVARLAGYNAANPDRAFQAIFIADGGTQLKNIVASLKKNAIDTKKIKLLGTGLWDDQTVAAMPEMAGAWFSSSPPIAYQHFEQRFKTTYGYAPPRLASLAYDAVTIAASIAASDPGGAVNTAALTDPAGFNTPANGMVRLKSDGLSDRRLAIMEVTPSGFKVIDAAPISF